MKVKMIAYTPEPERTVASAARLCYSQVGVEALSEKMSDEGVATFLKRLVDYGHDSPFEHVSFTFAIEGVSRVLTHQLVRHRIASYSQQSQRYVKLEHFDYIIPPAIEADSEARRIFIKAMEDDQKTYGELVERLEKTHFDAYLEKGYSEKKAKGAAEKSAIEDARFVFPNACETKIVVTMNARTLIHFFKMRCCYRAQWEIRALADEMLKRCREVAPILFRTSGPPCLVSSCPEGAMSCGSQNEVRQKYSDVE